MQYRITVTRDHLEQSERMAKESLSSSSVFKSYSCCCLVGQAVNEYFGTTGLAFDGFDTIYTTDFQSYDRYTVDTQAKILAEYFDRFKFDHLRTILPKEIIVKEVA